MVFLFATSGVIRLSGAVVGMDMLTPFLGTCPGWQDRVAVQCGLLMRMVADEGEVECD